MTTDKTADGAGLLRECRDFVLQYKLDNPKHVYKGVEQDPMGAHALLDRIDAYLATPSPAVEFKYAVKVKGGSWHLSNSLPSVFDEDPIESVVPLTIGSLYTEPNPASMENDELSTIHRLLMDQANCPDVADGDTLTVRMLKDLIHFAHRAEK